MSSDYFRKSILRPQRSADLGGRIERGKVEISVITFKNLLCETVIHEFFDLSSLRGTKDTSRTHLL